MSLHVTSASLTGNARKNNEDCLGFDERLKFFALADGMGGLPHGEVASETVVKAAVKAAATQPLDAQARTLAAFTAAIAAMRRKHVSHPGMGTTLVTLAFDRAEMTVVVGNAGDSRCYRLRAGRPVLLTKDQSTMGMVWGGITTNNLPSPKIDVVDVEPGDSFLLCSDGVSNELTINQIAEAMSPKTFGRGNLGGAARVVNNAVFDPGLGRDNASAVLVRVRR